MLYNPITDYVLIPIREYINSNEGFAKTIIFCTIIFVIVWCVIEIAQETSHRTDLKVSVIKNNQESQQEPSLSRKRQLIRMIPFESGAEAVYNTKNTEEGLYISSQKAPNIKVDIHPNEKLVSTSDIRSDVQNSLEVDSSSVPNNRRIVKQYSKLDSNKDGYLSIKESYLSVEMFHYLDSNGDEKISIEELNNILKNMKNEYQKNYIKGKSKSEYEFIETNDKNDDAKISLKEFGYDKRKAFNRLDKNRDGFITESDINSSSEF